LPFRGVKAFCQPHSGSLNLDPAEIRFKKNAFYDFEAPEEEKKAQEGASAAACAIGLYVSLDVEKRI
jgi:hypothetical protein